MNPIYLIDAFKVNYLQHYYIYFIFIFIFLNQNYNKKGYKKLEKKKYLLDNF